MGKKDLSNVTADLSALALQMPTQRAAISAERSPLKASVAALTTATTDEPVLQFSLSLRKTLRKQLARLAADCDMTMRAFVLDALKAKGLDVHDDDLLDLRRPSGNKHDA